MKEYRKQNKKRPTVELISRERVLKPLFRFSSSAVNTELHDIKVSKSDGTFSSVTSHRIHIYLSWKQKKKRTQREKKNLNPLPFFFLLSCLLYAVTRFLLSLFYPVRVKVAHDRGRRARAVNRYLSPSRLGAQQRDGE